MAESNNIVLATHQYGENAQFSIDIVHHVDDEVVSYSLVGKIDDVPIIVKYRSSRDAIMECYGEFHQEMLAHHHRIQREQAGNAKWNKFLSDPLSYQRDQDAQMSQD